jgi:hypothetical protein
MEPLTLQKSMNGKQEMVRIPKLQTQQKDAESNPFL